MTSLGGSSAKIWSRISEGKEMKSNILDKTGCEPLRV